jgi:hypothetical protein
MDCRLCPKFYGRLPASLVGELREEQEPDPRGPGSSQQDYPKSHSPKFLSKMGTVICVYRYDILI